MNTATLNTLHCTHTVFVGGKGAGRWGGFCGGFGVFCWGCVCGCWGVFPPNLAPIGGGVVFFVVGVGVSLVPVA